MQEQQQRKTITLSLGPLALLLLGTLLIGFLSGALAGGAFGVFIAGQNSGRSPAPNPAPASRALPAANRPWIGITYVPLNAKIAPRYGLTVTAGALIVSVTPHSPADEAGLDENDVVTAVDGRKLDETVSLLDALAAGTPGDSVTLTTLHKGQEQTIDVVLARSPTARAGESDDNLLNRFRDNLERFLGDR